MCKIYEYPSREDLDAMQTAVKIFLATRNGATRNAMQGALRKMLERYDIPKISFLDYIIEKGKQGGVKIISRKFTKGTKCPYCKCSFYGDTATILTIAEGFNGDMVTYGCGCGTITGKWEAK